MNPNLTRSRAVRLAAVSFVSALGLSALGLSGCDTIRAPGSATPDPLPNVAYPQIEAAEGLSEFLSYGEVKITGRTPLSVQVPIRARTESEDLRVQYRFLFLDDHGVALNPDAAWTYEKMASRRQTFWSGTAMTNRATDWRLQIRPTR